MSRPTIFWKLTPSPTAWWTIMKTAARSPSTRYARSSHVAKMGMDTGNPFVDGWLDLTDTVSGGGEDLGVSELAEKLGKDIYMDINGW